MKGAGNGGKHQWRESTNGVSPLTTSECDGETKEIDDTVGVADLPQNKEMDYMLSNLSLSH